ncbi:MAG: hypothetical protein KJI69_01905 [Patescibacteria group bacterium]|nr:hypothetical protein [Patescibacteria group bacterium]
MEQFQPLLIFIWQTFLAWWWLILPFVLFHPAKFMWLWWREELFWKRVNFKIYEIKISRDVEKPIKAMESVFAGLWQLYDPPNPRERWLEGQRLLSLSIEIVSTEGEVHFYLRIPEIAKKPMDSAIYAQFPDIELIEVEDYTKFVPQDIPNKDWDMWGTNFQLGREDVYPIRTYPTFFEENPEGKEEKRLDPMGILLEAFSRMGKGENLWLQMLLKPITPEDNNYPARGQEVVDRLVNRPDKNNKSTFMQDVGAVSSTVVTGNAPMEKKEEIRELIPPEMKLTPGERDIVGAIENKIGKYAFEVNLRVIHLAKREVFFSANKALFFSYFTQFGTANMNFFLPLSVTGTKVKTLFFWFLDSRRAFLKKRRLFRLYTKRLDPLFPRAGGMFILNIEEMATIFHFPGQMVSPLSTLPRLESKKGEAPPGLPTVEE